MRAREQAARKKPAAKAPAKAPAPPPPKAPPAEPAAPQPARQELKIIESVTLEEAAGQTLVRISTSGPVSYNASTGSELSREWIWLELFPVRTGPGVPERVPAKGGLLGEVRVGQADPERVKVSVQVLLPGISYVVTQQERAVVVKVVEAP